MTINLAFERSYPTPLQNSTLLPLLLLSLSRQKNSPDTTRFFNDKYDYIIVGAGSAGSVVAARLSEIPCVTVLLLEAGHAPPIINDVPAYGRNFWLTDLDWQYKTIPQKYTGNGLRDRQVTWPLGKALGGSSVLNDGLYVRGNKRNYDEWAEMGAKGWSFKEVLPYFKKMEDNKDWDYIANGYHGVGGPVTVMRPSYDPEIKEAVYRAATELGYEYLDSNGGRQTGFYDLQDDLRDNQRCQTAKAYLVPAENRPNLHILPNAFVTKVVINNYKATGVTFDYNNQSFTVNARKEVIMSAGTVNSAQLLMLSGIGPKEELMKHNIPVIIDLPVGQNFQDQAANSLDFLLGPCIAEFGHKISNPENVKQYIDNRTGPLCSPEGSSVMAFLLNDEVRPVIDFPNYQLYFVEASTQIEKEQYNLKPEVYQQLYGSYERHPFMKVLISQLQPRSIGSVTLRSASAYDEPLIDPNYLEDTRDVEDLVQGLKTTRRIFESPHLKKIGRVLETLIPGCEAYAENEDLYYRCQVQSYIITLGHSCGTAKMGDPADPSTVVDPELRVKGIDGLRVVDASIMPKVTSGNTNVPVIMIGEKGADIIKKSIQCWVKGIDGLRVVDASIMPKVTSGNTNVPVIMIGEKGADIIKKSIQCWVKGIDGLRVVDASIMPKVTSGNTNVPVIMIGEKGADIIKKSIQCW